MPKVDLVQDESGQIFARGPAGDLQRVTAQQAEQIHANPSGLSNMLGAAAEGVGALAAGAGPRELERVEKLQSLVVEKNFRAASKQLAKLSAAMPRVFPPWTIEAAKRASND